MVNPGELRGRRGMNERGGRGERGEHVGNGGSRQNGRFGGMGGHDGSLLTIPQPLQDQLTTGKEAIWMRIGSLRLSFDDKDGALNAYETALRYNPDSLTAMTQAGAVLVKTEQFPKVRSQPKDRTILECIRLRTLRISFTCIKIHYFPPPSVSQKGFENFKLPLSRSRYLGDIVWWWTCLPFSFQNQCYLKCIPVCVLQV